MTQNTCNFKLTIMLVQDVHLQNLCINFQINWNININSNETKNKKY